MPQLKSGKATQIGVETLFGGPPNWTFPKTAVLHAEFRHFVQGKAGHRGYFSDLGGMSDIGGDMYLRGYTNYHSPTPNRLYWRGGAAAQQYVGQFIAAASPASMPSPITVDSWGASAYASMKPTKPLMNLGNSLYELKDVPEMLRQRLASSGLKNVGSYYLALKFGWESLFGDLVNLFNMQQKLQQRIQWLLRHNGKPVRRRVTLRDDMSTPVVTEGIAYGSFNPVLVTQYYATQPTWRQRDWSTDKVWASARFRYWLPEGPRDVKWSRRLKAELFGLEPSPSVIWRSYPWSWLSDWFFNTGLVLQNLETGVADRLAADHFYVMRHVENNREYTAQGSFFDKSGRSFPVSATYYSNAFIKMRKKGDPFGFNTNPNGLSAGKLAILGALGLSKL